MLIPFEKWHGCQNDFIVVWLSANESKYALKSLQNKASLLCSRKGDGIGADGILVIEKPQHNKSIPEKLTIINSDGSIAKNCGNGLRCAAANIKKIHSTYQKNDDLSELELHVEGNHFICHYVSSNGDKTNQSIAINMGTPKINEKNNIHKTALEMFEKFDIVSYLNSDTLPEISTCEIGNLHIVIYLDKPHDLEKTLAALGPKFQKSPAWDGINVHIAYAREWNDEELQTIRRKIGGDVGEFFEACTWERGVGLTRACGSGATAIATAALRDPFFDRSSWVGIHMPGGTLLVKQTDEDGEAILAGATEYVFEGTFTL